MVRNKELEAELASVQRPLTKEEFGQRLYKLMSSRGWRQADLASKSGLTRDNISNYIRGVSFPTTPNLKKLALAFRLPEGDIFPNIWMRTVATPKPDFELRTSPSDPSMAWIRLERMVPLKVAFEIAQLIENAKSTD